MSNMSQFYILNKIMIDFKSKNDNIILSIKTITRFKRRFGYIRFQCESLRGILSVKFETYMHQMTIFRGGIK